jgi:6-phosphogluconolactonase
MADAARWNTFDDREALTRALATRIADALRTAIATNGRALFGVSGGSTPIPVYRALAQTDLPWQHVDVVLVDERFVPPTHRDSNEAMVRRELLQGAASGARFTGLWSDVADVDRAATLADRAVEGLGRDLDIGLLGMGDDGHYASIFPAGDGVTAAADEAQSRRVVTTTPDPLPAGAPHARLTLTLPYLLRAAWLPLAFTGGAKKSVYEHGAAAKASLPITRLRALAGSKLEVFWAE